MTPMSDGYRAVCPFCKTEIRGPYGGTYRLFVDAVRNLKTHWRISCADAPQMSRYRKDAIATSAVTVVENK